MSQLSYPPVQEGRQETLQFALSSMMASGMTEAQARKILGL